MSDAEQIRSPGSATPVSSTKTQSTPCWLATISSIAAIPISLTEQQRHPFGRDRKDDVCSPVTGSFRVRLFADLGI